MVRSGLPKLLSGQNRNRARREWTDHEDRLLGDAVTRNTLATAARRWGC